ncbi:MAG: peroxide stress protein YaaA [Saccharospirillaceae bacterium]|nr:peroxide stress protein YaaA [Pseudomonadales bacterium]NRB81080.1 peroxide stress protein YaaA [Saccharospirillaceae bacterium]
MLVVISPAKSLDYTTDIPVTQFSLPQFQEQTFRLAKQAKKLAPNDIATMMKLSENLSMLNYERFQHFEQSFTKDNARQAAYAFNGDVYTGLDFYSLDEEQVLYAQRHLIMLSGLYGVLRPLDLMQPYRLEMGTKFKTGTGKDIKENLYQFWGTTLSDYLNKEIASQQDDTQYLINLASTEYFKSVPKKEMQFPIIEPVFKDYKNGQYKIISFYAKKARGLMARFIIENKIRTPKQLQKFDVDGYQFSPELSKQDKPVFLRNIEAL